MRGGGPIGFAARSVDFGKKGSAAVASAEVMPGNEAGVLESFRMLTAVERSRGNYAEAARALARALEVSTAQQGPVSQRSAALLSEMASLERSQGHLEQALETIQKAIAMRETAAGSAWKISPAM